MTDLVTKRSGKTVKFNPNKIRVAISKANQDVKNTNSLAKVMTKEDISTAVSQVIASLDSKTCVDIEDIQDTVEQTLMLNGFYDISKSYILYRDKHRQQREASSELMASYNKFLFTETVNDDSKRENANINGDSSMGIMLKLGAEGAKTYAKYYAMPDEFAKAHIENWTHWHDLDFSMITLNCLQMDLLKLLHGGFNTGHGHIREPQSVRAYASLACVAIQSSQNDCFGG